MTALPKAQPSRRALARLTAALFVTLAAVGCGDFVDDGYDWSDDQTPSPTIRGFTACGDYVGETQYCQPGQFCENALWNRCEIGCLSDVNCASNQACIITSPNEPGYCQNL